MEIFFLCDDSGGQEAPHAPQAPGFSLCAEEGQGLSVNWPAENTATRDSNDFFLPMEMEEGIRSPAVNKFPQNTDDALLLGEEGSAFDLPPDCEPTSHNSRKRFQLPTEVFDSEPCVNVPSAAEDTVPEGERELRKAQCQLQSLLAKDSEGRVLGLVVREEYALQFIAPCQASRKRCEVRPSAVKCIRAGENVALLSCCGQAQRRVLAVLKYCGSMKIIDASHDRHLHQLSDEAFEELLSRGKNATGMWGWKFEVICKYSEALVVPSTSAQRWQRFHVQDVCEQAYLRAAQF